MPADAAILDAETNVEFTTRTIDADGLCVEIAETGQGAALIYAGSSKDVLAQLLGAQFHLFALDPGSAFAGLTSAAKAQRLAAIAGALGLEKYTAMVAGADCAAALYLAAAETEKLHLAVMVSPDVFDEKGVLREPELAGALQSITSHSLALFGTDEGGNARGAPSSHRQNIPNCHLMYVYDAEDAARSRPAAAAEVIADFLKRGDGFLVSEQDGRVFP